MSELSELHEQREKVGAALAALDRAGPTPSNPQGERQRSFLKHRLFVLDLAISEAEHKVA